MPFDEAYYQVVHAYDNEKWYKDVALGVSNLTYGLQGRILDVGCGRGYFMKEFLEMGKDVYGIDISDYAVSHPMPGCEGRIIKGDILDIPFKDNFFEWTICYSVMEHIPEGDIPRALKEIARVAPLSVMCIAILYSDDPRLEEFYKHEDETHITLKKFRWWVERFQEAHLNLEWYNDKMAVVLKRY